MSITFSVFPSAFLAPYFSMHFIFVRFVHRSKTNIMTGHYTLAYLLQVNDETLNIIDAGSKKYQKYTSKMLDISVLLCLSFCLRLGNN